MPNISLKDLVVHREALFKAYDDCFYRHACSKSSGPIEVIEIEKEPGKFQLVNGYHRLIQYLINRNHVKNNHEIPIKINDDFWVQDTFAIAPPNKRWDYDGSLKYGNLEDLADVSILDDHVKKLRKEKQIRKDKNLFEDISDSERQAIENAGPNTILTVYHGTPKFRLPQLINGFDSTSDFARDYRSGKHRGLFVTSDFELSKRFGGGAVLELKVPAKIIHGTDWSGFIGREQEKEKGRGALDWVKSTFPNSFRPYMAYTMLASGEPQGLLIGIVKPSQITKVWIYNHTTKNWNEWNRKDYLKSKDYYNARSVLDRTEYDYFVDTEINMADPKLHLDDFVKALAKVEGREGHEQTYVDYFKRLALRDPKRLANQLNDMELGGSRLGHLAAKNIIKQILSLVEKEKTTSESVDSNKENLIIEIMSHSKTLLKEGKIFNSNRFRKLAGILAEAASPGEVEAVTALVQRWLDAGGKEKIANYIENNVEDFYQSGEHISGDREGYYSVEPSEEEFANKDMLLDAHMTDIAEIASEELKVKILDFDLSEEAYQAMANMIGEWSSKIFPEIVSSASSHAPSPRRPRSGWSGEER